MLEVVMAGTRSVPIELSERQRELLERWSRSKKTSQRLVERSRIVLLSAAGWLNEAQAQHLGVDRQRVRRWRHRWAQEMDTLDAAEKAGASAADFEALVRKVLSDGARSGAPSKFTAEQVAALIALACESPGDSGVPVSHWTPSELAREAVKRGLVEGISPRQVDRFLARRTCDRTRASTGSIRRTNATTPNDTGPRSKPFVTSTDKPKTSPRKAPTS
jgi:transposase